MDGESSELRFPRALLLDLDDTLLDNSGIPGSVARACDAIAKAAPYLDSRQLLQVGIEAWSSYWPEVEESCWLGRMDGFAVSRETWRRTLYSCGCTDESIVEFAFEQHRQLGRDAYRLFVDVHKLLAYATERELRLALVTNGPSDLQRDKLRALRLDDSFDAVVISGELGSAKPDPAPFREAMKQVGVNACDVWHIGDGLMTDVAGAHAAGIVAVWLNRDGARRDERDPRPDVEVRSMARATELLRQASIAGRHDVMK